MPEEKNTSRISQIVTRKLREVREKANLSTRELGALLGVSHTYLWAIETGQKRINLDFLEKLAKYLGISPADLLREDSEFDTEAMEDRQLAELIDEWKKTNRKEDLILLMREFRNLTSEQIQSLVKTVKVIKSDPGKQKKDVDEKGDSGDVSGKTE